jgi:hypothetical protein
VRPLICYEDLFGEDFADSLVGPQSPTVLANASNLAWFGRWMMQDQHLQFSRMRAMEFQRPLVRSTNTGATAPSTTTAWCCGACPPGPRAAGRDRRRAEGSRPTPPGWPLAPAAAVAGGAAVRLAGPADASAAVQPPRNPKMNGSLPCPAPAGVAEAPFQPLNAGATTGLT